jgi:hypothetical protein
VATVSSHTACKVSDMVTMEAGRLTYEWVDNWARLPVDRALETGWATTISSAFRDPSASSAATRRTGRW